MLTQENVAMKGETHSHGAFSMCHIKCWVTLALNLKKCEYWSWRCDDSFLAFVKWNCLKAQIRHLHVTIPQQHQNWTLTLIRPLKRSCQVIWSHSISLAKWISFQKWIARVTAWRFADCKISMWRWICQSHYGAWRRLLSLEGQSKCHSFIR